MTMVLKRNLEYWQISLKNPEAAVDEYYIFNEVIIEDKELIRKVERLRELIISYCVMLEKDKKAAGEILNEIYEIIISNDKIQYTEFIAFWKALDMSFSVFKKLPNHKIILAELLETYCLRRRQLYEKLGYSNVTVQALYDSGVSRKKGTAGIIKVLDLASKNHLAGLALHLNSLVLAENIPTTGANQVTIPKSLISFRTAFRAAHSGTAPST